MDSKRTVISSSRVHVCLHSQLVKANAETFTKHAEAQGMQKGRRQPAVTRVGRHVDRRSPTIARKVHKVLKRAGKRIAAEVARLAASHGLLAKADDNDELIQKILDALAIEGISVDMVDAIAPELIDAFEKAGIYGVGQVGIESSDAMVEHLDRAAADYAAARGGELIKDFTTTTQDDLRSLLERGVKEGMSADELSTAIADLGAFGESRADMIARTELAFAHVQGNVEGWRETGMVEKKQWILGDLHDIEDECDEATNKGIVPLEAQFLPGISWPPAHPNCICDVLPILREDA